jgi:hypothetical protein
VSHGVYLMVVYLMGVYLMAVDRHSLACASPNYSARRAAFPRSICTLSRRGRPPGVSLAGAVDAGSSYRSSSMGFEARGGGCRGGVTGLLGVLETKI